ncbi:MAG: hypothetical protein NW200_05760 [Hyphomonadaceae bacterium]|nr:hypothetical protein [Hyphomonadaceae bacterium]
MISISLRARFVLNDATVAVEDFLSTPEHDDRRWRARYAAAIALLRTVGSVLHFEDSKQSAKLRAEIHRRWQLWKENPTEHFTFHHVIKGERDRVLHHYKHGWSSMEMTSGTIRLTLSDGRTVEQAIPPGSTLQFAVKPEFEGLWPSQALVASVLWWQRELVGIERAIG